jgi:hypothetical protein
MVLHLGALQFPMIAMICKPYFLLTTSMAPSRGHKRKSLASKSSEGVNIVIAKT